MEDFATSLSECLVKVEDLNIALKMAWFKLIFVAFDPDQHVIVLSFINQHVVNSLIKYLNGRPFI